MVGAGGKREIDEYMILLKTAVARKIPRIVKHTANNAHSLMYNSSGTDAHIDE